MSTDIKRPSKQEVIEQVKHSIAHYEQVVVVHRAMQSSPPIQKEYEGYLTFYKNILFYLEETN